MRKWLASVLLVGLVTGSLFQGAAVSPAFGATNGAKTSGQQSQSIKKPVHETIVFNDYEVVGLSVDGWNWVKNDEFILPPDTPLDIDLIQTTYGNQSAYSQSKVLLDGVELPEFSQAMTADEAVFRWEVPRFTIPADRLSPGVHTLTFIATDGIGQESQVQVLFRVEAKNYPHIYTGEAAQGEQVHSGETESIFGQYGSRSFSSDSPGDWRLTDKSNGAVIKTFSGDVFTTGVLLAGEYELSFFSHDLTRYPWQITLQVGLPTLYLGTDESGQKLVDKQKITAEAAPGTVRLFSPSPGSWWVNGTGQTMGGTKQFDVEIPENMAGMTLSVTFEPDQGSGGAEGAEDASITVDIQVPGEVLACDTVSSAVTMDLLSQYNEGSSLLTERSNLYSSETTVKIYQEPIYSIWIGTAAEHIKYGSIADDEEGPGVWAVNNVVVDSSKLNWSHTGLELSQFGPGKYKINYYSKENPALTWCGSIQVIEGDKPTPSAPVCEVGDSGDSPNLRPLKLQTKSGVEYEDGDRIEADSSDLEDLQELKLFATYVDLKGTKKVRMNKNKKNDRFLYLPDTEWEYGQVPFGDKNEFGSSPIASTNKVIVSYEGETIETFRAKRNDDEVKDGKETLDLASVIQKDGRKGEYTVEVINTASYRTCKIVSGGRSYNRDVDEVEKEQKLVFTVVVK